MRFSIITSMALTAAALARVPAQAAANGTTPLSTQPTEQLQEVVVTAEKRSEKLVDVPISITAISASQLNESASKNLQELQGMVPGITIPAATAYGGSTITIRGTSGAGTFLEDDPVAVYEDGIYQTSNSRSATNDLWDLAGLEVLRGPQGTLQGRNATAGAILINSADPDTQLDGYVSASVADPLEWRTTAAISIPVTDTLRVRLSGDSFDQRGWARNLYNDSWLGGERADGGRAVIVWEPSGRFRARLSIQYQWLVNQPALQRWSATAVNPTGVAENLAAPTPYVPLPPGLQAYYLDHNQVYNAIPSTNTQNLPEGALELHYDLGLSELVSLTGLSRHSNVGINDSDGLGPAGTNGVSVIDAATGEYRRAWNTGVITGTQATEELRLQSRQTQRYKWLIGAFVSRAIDDMKFDILDYDVAATGDSDVGFRAHQLDTSKAGFVDATYDLTQKLSVTGGVRYTTEDKTFHNDFSVTIPEIDLVVVGPLPYAPPTGTWDATTYRANLQYRFTDETNAYVGVSKGFKSGGFNAFGTGPTPNYEPEYLESTEAGVKSYFWDRRGYLSAAAYYNDYTNLQVTAGVPTGGVNIYNAAKARIDGFEFQGQVRPAPGFSLLANLAYTHAYYVQFQNGQGVDGNLVNATGNTLPNSPTWQYYVQGDYSRSLDAEWMVHTQVSYRWRGEVYFFGTNEEPNLTGAPDGELGARLDFTYDPTNFTLSAYGRNLTDTRVVTAEQVFFAYPVAYFNEPRVLGLEFTKRF